MAAFIWVLTSIRICRFYRNARGFSNPGRLTTGYFKIAFVEASIAQNYVEQGAVDLQRALYSPGLPFFWITVQALKMSQKLSWSAQKLISTFLI